MASRFGISIVAGQAKGQRFRLGGAGCMVGRAKGAILFPDDVHVSPHHGTFLLKEGKLFIRDEASLSGIFVTTNQDTIHAGACFAAGRRLFRFTGALSAGEQPVPGRPIAYGAPVPPGHTLYGLEEILVGGRGGRVVVSAGPLLSVGQQQCDLSYPGDDGLAMRHCELNPSGDQAVLRDLSGGLGTWVRIPPGVERPLVPGDRVRIGAHVLRVEAIA